MPETDELMIRLKQLEDGYYGDKEAARQKNFFDTYGARFSNNRGLGMAILNELDARGIDTSAADEAVQQILDTLRTECNEIIEAIKDVQETAIENAQKVEAISEIVQDTVAGNPMAEAEADVMTPPADMPPMSEETGTENPVPDEQMPADMPPAPEEQMPADMPPVPQENPVGQEMANEVSDARLKKIRTCVSDMRAKRVQKDMSNMSNNSFKPSAGILSAAQGGR